MSISDKLVAVGLYLKGHDLDPQKITEAIGLEPTFAHRRGEKKATSAGSEFVTKIGLWGLVIEEEPAEMADVVEKLIETLRPHARSLQELPQVQEAYIDIFVATDTNVAGESSCEMSLTADQIGTLSKFELPIRLTVSIGRP
jgi:hypothetical protein